MKFLVDAQLPFRLADWLRRHGHDARHPRELPLGNRTRVVITKDSDFVESFLLTGEPPLLLVTGNVANRELASLLRGNLVRNERAFASARFVELTPRSLIVHR